ncbi:MAG TPA: imidazoleglycerol-phosphate dehydratase HisB [Dehalococcoidia bacterium]|nr:imidazoleglycerol-phosphate dehydratase HisB [Dehalococcoidia bacterium]
MSTAANPAGRSGEDARETTETRIHVRLTIDGSGRSRIRSGIGMFDHLLDQLARHSLMDLEVEASGDIEVDAHHTVEDVGICLGRALNKALGERRGIVRMADRTVPMDEALVQVALDLSGRPFAAVDLRFHGERIGSLPAELIEHFLMSFAFEARIALHVRELAGKNDHHRAEAAFKALARALGDAAAIDARREGSIASTKGTLSG